MEAINIEYEWQPSRCDTCKIFDHIDDQCPMKVTVVASTQESDDEFVEVTRRHEKGKQNGKPRHTDDVRLAKPQPKYFYRAVSKPINPKENKEAASQSNGFSALEEDNGNPMDDLVDETRKKVEVPPKKTPRKTSIWSSRKAESP
nr:hypothetical protein [Tanacetum cinerariifolium]